MNFRSVNPKNGKVLRDTVSFFTRSQLDESITKSFGAFLKYRDTDLRERLDKIGRLRKELENNQETYAKLITDEMGKPFLQAESEIKKCLGHCKYYEENAERYITPTHVKTEASKSYVSYEPLGPLLSIFPWNFPFWLPIKAVIPQLALGNTILYKPAPSTSLCGEALEGAFIRAGLEDEFKLIYLNQEDTEFVLADERVKGVCFTGSTKGGKAIAEIAGRNLKKSVLELGGSDPFIVLDDANVDRAAYLGCQSRLANNGQA
jgi:succinate-semialdehyde dehydrogenase/glutarate-semialdehyde dehydrogenase